MSPESKHVGVRTESIEIPMTPRLASEAERWATHGVQPEGIVRPEPGQESVWDYPRPPALQRVLERVTIEFAGQRIVDTTMALRVCETASPPTYYIPIADIRSEFLRVGAGSSACEWKGVATYFSLMVGAKESEQCAWTYQNPTPEYEALVETIAFYPGRVDRCTVGDFEVTPQPGEFYAGWVTPDLVGPFKGEPGSHGW